MRDTKPEMLEKLAISCDSSASLARAAIWRGREIVALYVDSKDMPDLTGAVARGKISRIMSGQKIAYVDCGDGLVIRAPLAVGLRAGEKVFVRITEAPRHGKAWGGKICASAGEHDGEGGIIEAAPNVWQRAIAEAGAANIGGIIFSGREEMRECLGWAGKNHTELTGRIRLERDDALIHEMEETISRLIAPRVSLASGAELVIETTEALVAVDVNAAESANPLATNLLAVRELARQARLRNLSGIMVMDSLKMRGREDNSKLHNAAVRAFAGDPAQVRISGVSRLGLLELARQRRGYSLHEVMKKGDLK